MHCCRHRAGRAGLGRGYPLLGLRGAPRQAFHVASSQRFLELGCGSQKFLAMDPHQPADVYVELDQPADIHVEYLQRGLGLGYSEHDAQGC